MFSTTIKRSVATLGVVAGLLAAAVPASAQIAPATMGNLHTGPGPRVATIEPLELNTFGGNDTLRATVTCLDQDMSTVKAPANSPSCGVSESDSLENTMVSGYNVKADAEGEQVGSEGVKAPTGAVAPIDSSPGDDNVKGPASAIWVWHEAARNGIATAEVFELNTFGGNDTLDARTNPSFTVDPQDGATRSAPPMGVTANAGTGDDNADGLLDETAQPQLTDGTSNTLQYAAARQARGFPSVDGLKFDTDVVDY